MMEKGTDLSNYGCVHVKKLIEITSAVVFNRLKEILTGQKWDL